MKRSATATITYSLTVPVTARRRPHIEAGVQRIITLAPILGRCNPAAVATVEDVIRNLIGTPPHGGLEQTVTAGDLDVQLDVAKERGAYGR